MRQRWEAIGTRYEEEQVLTDEGEDDSDVKRLTMGTSESPTMDCGRDRPAEDARKPPRTEPGKDTAAGGKHPDDDETLSFSVSDEDQ
jgi:hypothetical protein